MLLKRLINKKVFLRERKKHTARHTTSARYADRGGRVPHPVLDEGVPSPL